MPDRPIIKYEHLSPVEKAVYVTGAVANGVTWLLEAFLDRAATVVVETERAFQQGRDPNVEDAEYRDL